MDQPEAVSLSSMWQNTASAGALDTDTPFLLRGNRVYLPMGGDWVLTEQPQEGAPGEQYEIYTNMDENERVYLTAEPKPTVSSSDTAESSAGETEAADAETEGADDIEQSENARWISTFLLRSESLGREYHLEFRIDTELQMYLSIAEDSDGE